MAKAKQKMKWLCKSHWRGSVWKWFCVFKSSIYRQSNQVLRRLWMVGEKVTFFFSKEKRIFLTHAALHKVILRKINSLIFSCCFLWKKVWITELSETFFPLFTKYCWVYWKDWRLCQYTPGSDSNRFYLELSTAIFTWAWAAWGVFTYPLSAQT